MLDFWHLGLLPSFFFTVFMGIFRTILSKSALLYSPFPMICVTSMAWCPTDSSYLLFCAKDNQTIYWDTVSGEIVCELPAGTNWNFDVHWYSKIPGIISTSSFDGKFDICNIEDKLYQWIFIQKGTRERAATVDVLAYLQLTSIIAGVTLQLVGRI